MREGSGPEHHRRAGAGRRGAGGRPATRATRRRRPVRPRRRAFGPSPAPTSAACRPRSTASRWTRWFPRSSPPSSSPPPAGTRRSRCAPSTLAPTATATRPSARWWRPTPATCPSWWTRSPPSFQSWNVGIGRVLHPIIGTDRDEEGRIVGSGARARGAQPRVGHPLRAGPPHLDDDLLVDLAAAIHGVLSDVLKVVADFRDMIERVGQMEELADASTARYGGEEIEEAALFRRWLRQGNFVVSSATASTRSPRAGCRSRPTRGWGCCATRGPPYARPVLLEQMPRACASA